VSVGRHTKQIAEAIKWECFDASVHVGAQTQHLVECDGILAGHRIGDFGLPPPPTFALSQSNPKLFWNPEADGGAISIVVIGLGEFEQICLERSAFAGTGRDEMHHNFDTPEFVQAVSYPLIALMFGYCLADLSEGQFP